MNCAQETIGLEFFGASTEAPRPDDAAHYRFELCEAQRAPKPYPYAWLDLTSGAAASAPGSGNKLAPFVPRHDWTGTPSPDWSAPCLIALTNAQEGREKEFDDWYWNQHFPDGLRLPGCFAGRRYHREADGSGEFRHLAIYQFDLTDMAVAVNAVAARSGTPEMPLTDTISSVFQAWFVSPSMR
ncbi:MAG: hypothetical protein WA989_10395 [Henriciella sp.]|uniref:hypothetical protein n=1 Tax=Henriciella sp. TaxID=1968823 RepID=UPI003C737269